jgi:mono/diheme cytochrome c family protein
MTGWAALVAATAVAAQVPPSPDADHGRAIAERSCAMCHAVGQDMRSPNAAAPSFRALELRYGAAMSLERALRRVAREGHFEMAPQALSDADVEALAAYVASLGAP